MNNYFKTFLKLFLGICILVHIAGLIHPITTESVLSHIIHIFSYSVGLSMVLWKIKHRLIIYFLASIYPIYYHANCLLHTASSDVKSIVICSLVVFLLPFAGYLISKEKI